jgi:hypothetical protein
MDDSLREAFDYVLREYGSKGYLFWKDLTGRDAMVLTHPSDPNLQIEVSAMWDRVKPAGAIRVMVSTFEPRPQRFRVKVPTRSLLVFEDGRVDAFGTAKPESS